MHPTRKQSQARSAAASKLAASEKFNANFVIERDARAAANLARTLELKAKRLAKEAQDKQLLQAESAVAKAPSRRAAKDPVAS